MISGQKETIVAKEILLKLNYQQEEVVSAQRLRFRNSQRIRIIFAMMTVFALLLAVQQFILYIELGKLPGTWFMPLVVLGIVGGVWTVGYFVAPPVDFRFNRDWRTDLDLHLQKDQLRVSGKSDSVDLPWGKIKRVLENDKVFIIIMSSELDFLIVPKRVLQNHTAFFQEQLKPKPASKHK